MNNTTKTNKADDFERAMAADIRTWHEGPLNINILSYTPYDEPTDPSPYAGNLSFVGEFDITYDGYHRAIYGATRDGRVSLYAN